MTAELAATMLEIAFGYRRTGRELPPHVVADLQDIARLPSLPAHVRHEAARLLRKDSTP